MILLPLLLFFLPSMLALFGSGDHPPGHRVVIIVMASLYAAIFCLNYFWIVPATMIRENNKPLFFLYNFIAIMLACMFVPIWFEATGDSPHPHGPEPPHASVGQHIVMYLRFVLRDVITMIFAAALGCALRLAHHQEKLRRRELQLDSERHNIELQSLKAQLNPHFLFNAINNIYSLIAVSSDRAQKALHEFSGLLRFLIYDASNLYVPMAKEMEFIRDYVELMRLRLSPSMRLDCEITDCEEMLNMKIAPLLLLTIIENAFKHAGRNSDGYFISISISMDDKWLVCRVSNSCNDDDTSHDYSSAGSGVGLVNVESQLRLLYPSAFSFDYGRIKDTYISEIRILRSSLIQES